MHLDAALKSVGHTKSGASPEYHYSTWAWAGATNINDRGLTVLYGFICSIGSDFLPLINGNSVEYSEERLNQNIAAEFSSTALVLTRNPRCLFSLTFQFQPVKSAGSICCLELASLFGIPRSSLVGVSARYSLLVGCLFNFIISKPRRWSNFIAYCESPWKCYSM